MDDIVAELKGWKETEHTVAHIPTQEGQDPIDRSIRPIGQVWVCCGMPNIPESQTMIRAEAASIIMDGKSPVYLYEGLSHCLACCYAFRKESGNAN